MADSVEDSFPKRKASERQPQTNVGVAVAFNAAEPEAPDAVALKRLFQIALETRNFEISQLVQRNNFFMIFQGVLLAGLVQSSHSKPVISFLVCLAGLLVSICQVQMAAGAKFWQEYWEAALQQVEVELMHNLAQPETGRSQLFYLFHSDESTCRNMVEQRLRTNGLGLTRFLVMKRFSVSRAPIYVAVALTVVWGLLLFCAMRGYTPLSIPSFVVGF